MKRRIIILTAALLVSLSGCKTTAVAPGEPRATELTVGLVQKEITKGMDAADVALALGSPNIVKKNSTKGETWIYDRFSSEQIHQTAGGGIGFGAGDVGIAVGGSSGKTKTQSSALTVIITFDEQSKVDTIAYHRSKY